MGTDMIRKATDAFERKQRRCLDRFEEPNLFSGAPKLAVAVVATPVDGHSFCVGEEYRLSRSDRDIRVIRGVTAVGHIENPPPSILDSMQAAGAAAVGRVVVNFSLTGKAELLLE